MLVLKKPIGKSVNNIWTVPKTKDNHNSNYKLNFRKTVATKHKSGKIVSLIYNEFNSYNLKL